MKAAVMGILCFVLASQELKKRVHIVSFACDLLKAIPCSSSTVKVIVTNKEKGTPAIDTAHSAGLI